MNRRETQRRVKSKKPLMLWIGMFALCLGVSVVAFALGGSVPRPHLTVFTRYEFGRRSLIVLRGLSAGGGPTLTPTSIDQVASSIFDSTNNALRINALLTPGGTHTPNDANQVFVSIFDSTNNAIKVNCVAGCASGGATASFATYDHDVHVDGTTYTNLANAVAGNPLANACSTTLGCAIYDELSSSLLTTSNQNPFFGPKNYEVHLGHGSETGSNVGIFYATVPVVLGADQVIGSGRPTITSATGDGSTGTVIRACAGTGTVCGSSYFVTASPPPPQPTLTPSGTGTTGTLFVQLTWVVNLHTGPDAGLTAGKYASPGESMPGPEQTLALGAGAATVTVTAPCAAATCVFNGAGGNPPDFGTFATAQAYAKNQYVYGTGSGAGHLYRAMQAVASSSAVTFNGIANEQVNDGTTNCGGGACYYQESGPDANWLAVVGYNVYATLVSSGGEVLQTATGNCTTVVTIGPEKACTPNSTFVITLASMQTTTIGQPLTDTTHPLTALGLTPPNSISSPFGSRFENLMLDGNEQAGQCGAYIMAEELSGYYRVDCRAATESFFTVLSGAPAAPSIGTSSNSFMQEIGAGAAFREGGVRYGMLIDQRTVIGPKYFQGMTVTAYNNAGGNPTACIYIAGTPFTSAASALPTALIGMHTEQCVDGIFVGGGTATIIGHTGNGVTNMVHVSANATGCNVSSDSGAGGTNSIVVLDDLNGITYQGKQPYVCGIGQSKVSTSAVTITGAATDINVAEIALPVGWLNGVNRMATFLARGTYQVGGTAGTTTWKIKLCTVSGCGSGTVKTLTTVTSGTDTISTTAGYEFAGDVECTTTGTNGNVIGHGVLKIALGGAAATLSVYEDANTSIVGAIALNSPLYMDLVAQYSAVGTGTNAITANSFSARPVN